jgi:hypothetical protein
MHASQYRIVQAANAEASGSQHAQLPVLPHLSPEEAAFITTLNQARNGWPLCPLHLLVCPHATT